MKLVNDGTNSAIYALNILNETQPTLMTVLVFLSETSYPIEHNEVKNTYTKGPLYCIMFDDGSVTKFPIANIFRVHEKNME